MRCAVIFLDIDGVLCTGNSCAHDVYDQQERLIPNQRAGHSTFDPIAMAYLNRLCEITGARIVVSSTWRNDDELPDQLRHHGFAGQLHPDWRTPHLPGSRSYRTRRGREIAAWLLAHPEEVNYAILDDDGDMLPAQLPRFVQTHGWYGLGLLECERVKEILGFAPILGAEKRAEMYRTHARTLRRLARREAPRRMP